MLKRVYIMLDAPSRHTYCTCTCTCAIMPLRRPYCTTVTVTLIRHKVYDLGSHIDPYKFVTSVTLYIRRRLWPNHIPFRVKMFKEPSEMRPDNATLTTSQLLDTLAVWHKTFTLTSLCLDSDITITSAVWCSRFTLSWLWRHYHLSCLAPQIHSGDTLTSTWRNPSPPHR